MLVSIFYLCDSEKVLFSHSVMRWGWGKLCPIGVSECGGAAPNEKPFRARFALTPSIRLRRVRSWDFLWACHLCIRQKLDIDPLLM